MSSRLPSQPTPAAQAGAGEPPAEREPRALAELVQALGTPALGEAMLAFLRTQAAFDSALILLYHRRRRPRVLIEALGHPLRRNNAAAYLNGAYLLDPFRVHAQRLRTPAMVRLRDIAPPDFLRSAYYRDYYTHSQLSDEINYLVPVAAHGVVAVCLGRSRSAPAFDDAQRERLQRWLPLVGALLRRHLQMSGAPAPAREAEDREHQRLEARLAAFGAGTLTPREHEVVQHLLRGQPASAIAALLGVSVQTVRVHRRNIYAKLGISSLGQLFSLAMGALLDARG